ncbi:MAG: hypothetical protein RIK87_20040, partial [Fuerstiella sp.]
MKYLLWIAGLLSPLAAQDRPQQNIQTVGTTRIRTDRPWQLAVMQTSQQTDAASATEPEPSTEPSTDPEAAAGRLPRTEPQAVGMS